MIITEKMRRSKSVMKGRRKVSVGASCISCVTSRGGQPIASQGDILKRIKEFHTDLFASLHRRRIELEDASDDLQGLTPIGVTYAMVEMSNEKAAGTDGLPIGSMKVRGVVQYKQLAKLFTRYLRNNETPD